MNIIYRKFLFILIFSLFFVFQGMAQNRIPNWKAKWITIGYKESQDSTAGQYDF